MDGKKGIYVVEIQYVQIDAGLKKHLDRLLWKNKTALLRQVQSCMKNRGGRGERAPNHGLAPCCHAQRHGYS